MAKPPAIGWENPFAALPAEFTAEWDQVHRSVQQQCDSILTGLGMSQPALNYVQRLRGYQRLPYLTALWVLEPGLRVELGVAVGIHCVGIKLLDDLIDGDQPFERLDLCLGAYLLQQSAATMSQFQNPREIQRAFSDDYRVIWKQQWDELRRPPGSIEEWLLYAGIKAGQVMGNYAEVACLAAGVPTRIPAARRFGEPFGVIIMAADDLLDHVTLNQTDGNLGHLIKSGVVSIGQARELVEEQRTGALAALDPGEMAHDIRGVVNAYADDVLDRLLGEYEA